MDSLQLSELQAFINANKGEVPSKFSVESVDCTPFEQVFDPVLERLIDLSEFLSYDNNNNNNHHFSHPISSDFVDQSQSLPQVVLDATAVVHGEKYPGEGSVIPPPVVNFLEPGYSPEESDVTSYYSDDSSPATQQMPEFSQLTSPGADAPSTSFQWPPAFDTKNENFAPSACYANPHTSSEGASLPYVTSPTTSVPSPASTVYSVSSPGTPGSSAPCRGRRPHGSTAPYSTKSSRRRQVEKGTIEYVEKRARNNVAVRKSRAKAKEKQQGTEVRVKVLLDQNEQLQKKVDLLTKELNVLKGLFMNVGASIPDDFLRLVGDS